jgi:hypothetical protein
MCFRYSSRYLTTKKMKASVTMITTTPAIATPTFMPVEMPVFVLVGMLFAGRAVVGLNVGFVVPLAIIEDGVADIVGDIAVDEFGGYCT